MDFFKVDTRSTRKGSIEIFPKFLVGVFDDLMVRGRDFYAIWDPDANRWTTKELVVFNNIDKELYAFRDEYVKTQVPGQTITVRDMKHTSSGMVDIWHKFVQRQMRDNYVPLDTKLMFSKVLLMKLTKQISPEYI